MKSAALTLVTLLLLAVPAQVRAQKSSAQESSAQDSSRMIPTNARLRSLKSGADTARLIRGFARAMRLDFDTTPEFGDYRRLTIGTCPDSCRLGPLSKIQPRRRSAMWTTAQRDTGEVIARIISDGPYPKFNIHGQDTVIWRIGKRDGRLVSLFVSSATDTVLVSDLRMVGHPSGFWVRRAFARWLWSDTDDLAWGTCDGGTCCQSSGGELIR